MKLYQITVRAIALVLALFAFTAGSASAQQMAVTVPVTPQGDFGSQPALTFGGSGIPNNWVMTNSSANQTLLGVQLALTATQRYSNPAVTNNGAGTFFAQAGVDNNPPSPTNPYAVWNFDFAITGAGSAGWSYRLWYDFNPAANNFGDYGYINIAPVPTQNSWNLGMDFLSLPIPLGLGGIIFPPSTVFDPTVGGEYGFALIAYDQGLNEVGRTAMLVDTRGAQEVVPEPATMTLLATGLAGMAATRRKKKNAAQV